MEYLMANPNFHNPYVPKEIEQRWQNRWEKDQIYAVDLKDTKKEAWFALSMYPYPSGDVHVGHWYAFAPADAHARFMRMSGYNVFHPQGFDAFGLPAENAAIKHSIDPKKWTWDNIKNMRRQFKLMGNSYDWSREVVTCAPDYYKWNQYFFIKMFEKGLAYRDKAAANWCTGCNTTLANEQVKEGVCERCNSDVITRHLEQWFFKITDYADQLLEMESIDWPDRIKLMQRNWIGKSNGAMVKFNVENSGVVLETFTTRIDTLFGVEFLAIAPENPLLEKVSSKDVIKSVREYVNMAKAKTELQRIQDERLKTGVHTGAFGINPLSKKRIPIFVADYVIQTYGSGVVMGVPAHDQRDFLFAKKYNLDITQVVTKNSKNGAGINWDGNEAYSGGGVLVNSGEFNSLDNEVAKEGITKALEKKGVGRKTTTYRLRDWLISRQRYWGTPIPMVYCEKCGTVPVSIDELPVTLPDEPQFSDSSDSPLKQDDKFVNTSCPRCGSFAKRETDTMDTFMDSSWYHLRYLSPKEKERPFNEEDLKGWAPIHQYTGGAEHAVMHLFYARFLCKVLRDFGLINFGEPYKRLYNQGVLIAEHKKISKRSNPLNPEPLVEKYGADAVRAYLMFLGPWDQGGNWSHQGINGIVRWLKRVWIIAFKDTNVLSKNSVNGEEETKFLRLCNTTSERVVRDMRQFKFNTAIATLMEMARDMAPFYDAKSVSKEVWEDGVKRLILHLAPIVPHIAEEMWHKVGEQYSVHTQALPKVDQKWLTTDKVKIMVQINGKLRGELESHKETSKEEAIELLSSNQKIAPWLIGKSIGRSIYVDDKLLNLVLKN